MSRFRNTVYEWEGDDTQPYPVNFIWRSRKYLIPYEKTFNCAVVIAVTDDREEYYNDLEERKRIIRRNNARISANAVEGAIGEGSIGEDIEIDGDELEEVPTVSEYSGDFNLQVKFYIDGVLHFTKEIYALDKPFRIPGGVRGTLFEVQIEGNVRVKKFVMADSMDELKQIIKEKDKD